jgi:ubiquinone/menaquinone biosynthesis C-methylase UbiE
MGQMSKSTQVGPMGSASRIDLYDPLVRVTLRERRFKRRLLEQARLRPGLRILDVGCGTGTLAVMAKQTEPGAALTGLDCDGMALALAQRKIRVAGVAVVLHRGLAEQLPYPDGSFDRVLSTLLFHHLTAEGKRRALAEIARVLCPGGELHLADFGHPSNPLMRWAFYPVRKADGWETT